MMPWYYGLASLLGTFVGGSEIVSRYRDAPDRALRTLSAWLYILLNTAASAAALALVRNVDALSGIGGVPDGAGKLLIQALAAGLSAMALFRSSLFMIRVGNTDIGIGPAAFLQVLLTATDRATDRARAKPRAKAVREIMGGISFALAKEALPSLCFGLMQGLTPDEQATFSIGVKALEASAMEDAFKANSLGLSLMTLVGDDVLREAVNMLRADISAKPKVIVQSIPTLALLQRVDFASASDTMVDGCLFVTNRMGDSDLSKQLAESLRRIRAMQVSDRQKVLFLSAALIVCFGEDVLQNVLRSILSDQPQGGQSDVASAAAVVGGPPPAPANGAAGYENVVAINPGAASGEPAAAEAAPPAPASAPAHAPEADAGAA